MLAGILSQLGVSVPHNMTVRQGLSQVLNFIMIICSAYMLWQGAALLCNTESPIVVVLSESMEPAFARGDILFLSMSSAPIVSGDIVVFNLKNHVPAIPIVHRVLKTHVEAGDKKDYILTKGDNNEVDDTSLYTNSNPGQKWIRKSDIMGRVQGYLPYIGYITIIMHDFPQLKYVLLGLGGLLVLLHRE